MCMLLSFSSRPSSPHLILRIINHIVILAPRNLLPRLRLNRVVVRSETLERHTSPERSYSAVHPPVSVGEGTGEDDFVQAVEDRSVGLDHEEAACEKGGRRRGKGGRE